MDKPIRVIVAGAGGRMGKEVVKLALGDQELELAAAVGRSDAGKDAGEMVGMGTAGVLVTADLQEALSAVQADVLVDFTNPEFAYEHANLAIAAGVRPVMGTTGYTPEQIEELNTKCEQAGIGGLIAPNFSIGAILLMRFSALAAKHFPHLEIIEYHGDQKLDAPSGTAVKTAEMISEVRESMKQGNPNEKETIAGSRGGEYDGFRIHSVRLPGVFAQQEVIFGSFGQSLKIRHDSYERAGYMPGVKIGVQKVMEYTGMVYGFERFVD
ncbi:4-hydroxy-tetrahydrodipicolinate reductase [Paenibacillus wulumuqiensis]|uniref:4-hydroxy-tetrahydrodipicolinate reductase n=1 Tax=Paenibacillus wulumuqiensis TaxID=1567107 RepID=UPI0006199659|nr:4-hydroxy-tetrahydrodipicolinate reductase [Paenibacillus wulumuqiensis]